jgi:hypothetical protein
MRGIVFILDGNSKNVFNQLGVIYDDKYKSFQHYEKIVLTQPSSQWVLDALNNEIKYTYYPISADGLMSVLSYYSSEPNSLLVIYNKELTPVSQGFINMCKLFNITVMPLINSYPILNKITFPSDLVHNLLRGWLNPTSKRIVITSTFEQSMSKSLMADFTAILINKIYNIEDSKIIILNDSSEIGEFKTKSISRSTNIYPAATRFAPKSISENILLIAQLIDLCDIVVTQENIIYDIASILNKKIVLVDRSCSTDEEFISCTKTKCDLSVQCEESIPCTATFDPDLIYNKIKEVLC